jgi:hypothetical protein
VLAAAFVDGMEAPTVMRCLSSLPTAVADTIRRMDRRFIREYPDLVHKAAELKVRFWT